MTNEMLKKMAEAYTRIGGIAVLGLVGVLLMVALLVAWRRHLARQRQMEARRDRAAMAATEPVDVWRAGGKRLTPPPPPPPEDAEADAESSRPDPYKDEEHEDDEEGDEGDEREWWQKGP